MTRRRRVLTHGSIVMAVAMLAGCSSVGGVTTGKSSAVSATRSATPTPDPTPAVVAITPADHSADVLPSAPVTVKASVGTVTAVTLKDDAGAAVDGTLDAGKTTWTAGRFLKPAATYTLEVSAKGPDGTPTTAASTFTTLKPAITATYGINYTGTTVGVGMPVAIQFDSQVQTKEMRAQVEKLVSVTTEPATEGSWGWLDNRQLMWRPKEFWVPGTKVTVKAPLTGVQTGDNKWVANDASGAFTIGDSHISYIDIPGHTMTVTSNGATVNTMPVSNGRPGPSTETRSGIKVIIERKADITMDSTSIGIPEGQPGYYKVDTNWNLRVTWTGEFLHSAPWSVDAQGSDNVSHGCTNLSPANAEWMYNFSRPGDVVVATGSGRTFLPTEGIGVWQYSYDQWKAQSALT